VRTAVDLNHDPEQPVNYRLTHQTGLSKTDADAANTAFDASINQFLRQWISQGTTTRPAPADPDTDLDTFVENGALRSFFKHHDHPLRDLLADAAIARHLLRLVSEVHFENDAYEPMLARAERRIYNLAAHREHLEIPFRYAPTSRQHPDGDPLSLAEMIERQGREDIGMYFGTRRSDETALDILARQLQAEAAPGSDLPVHVVTEGYMTESLERVKADTLALHLTGDPRLHCFLIQRRHAEDDRHLGAALLLMNPAQPLVPQRIVFCDTLRPGALPPWWNKFKHKIDYVFPQPEGELPVSDRLEDGGVNLQRLHDGVAVRHQDIDCAFYSASMVRALVRVVRATPGLIVYGSTEALVSAMTARMPEYFDRADQPLDPVTVREANVVRRWNTGRDALLRVGQATDSGAEEGWKESVRIESSVPNSIPVPIRSLTLSDQTLALMGLPVAAISPPGMPVGRRRLRRLTSRRPERPRPIRRLTTRPGKRLMVAAQGCLNQ
jgi:hypothetical protein